MNVYRVTVQPQARESRVEPVGDDSLIVRVIQPAREGKANKAVIKLLAKHFAVPKSAVLILSGVTGRHKRIGIRHD